MVEKRSLLGTLQKLLCLLRRKLESIAFRNVFMYNTYQKADVLCGDRDLPFLKLTPCDKRPLNECVMWELKAGTSKRVVFPVALNDI